MHNMAKVTSGKYNHTVVPYGAHSGTRKLDIYLGYAEDLVAICARISDLPLLLNSDPHALTLEVSSMSVLLCPITIKLENRTNKIPEAQSSRPGPQRAEHTSCPRVSHQPFSPD